MSNLLLDIRSGLRIMRAHPGFTAVVVIVLALGIGTNTTIFGVLNALLFAPLPYKDADQILSVTETGERLRGGGPTSYPTFLDWKSQNPSFDDMAAFSYQAVNLAGGGEPERLGAIRVSEGAIALLGVKPSLGRPFLASEFTPDGERIVLLSHSLWQRRFGARSDIIGQTIMANGQACTVIGVLPAQLKMAIPFGYEPALWMPLSPSTSPDRSSRSLLVLARLKPGITLTRARSDMEAIARRIQTEHPDSNKGWSVMVSPLRGEVDTAAYVLLAILIGAILGLVCANVTNLLLARATVREREIAIRAALGASRMRLVRQLLTENLLLLLAGCGLGVMLAVWICSLVGTSYADTNLGMLEIKIDVRVLAATMILFLLAGAMVGLFPALQISRSDLRQALQAGGKSPAGASSRRRLRSLLVASEVALSLLLLTGASLAAKSWLRLWTVDPGFHPERVLTMRISLTGLSYPDGPRQASFFRQLLDRLQTRSEIQAAGVASDLPTASPERAFHIAGRQLPAAGEAPQARLTSISTGYFSAMGIPLHAGRQFSETDAANAQPVAIVNEALARKYWNDQNPIGSRIELAGATRTIIGVAGNVRSVPLSLKPVPEIYVPFTQMTRADMALVIQTKHSDPLAIAAAVKQEVHAADPNQPVSGIMTMDRACSANMGVIKLGTSVIGLVALGALILAALGIYGVISCSVTQRTGEIGIRMALGAQRRDVLGMVLRQGVSVTLLGIVPGLAASFVLGRVLSSALFGVSSMEIWILAGISLLIIMVALLACYLPARRAATVDPMQALRML